MAPRLPAAHPDHPQRDVVDRRPGDHDHLQPRTRARVHVRATTRAISEQLGLTPPLTVACPRGRPHRQRPQLVPAEAHLASVAGELARARRRHPRARPDAARQALRTCSPGWTTLRLATGGSAQVAGNIQRRFIEWRTRVATPRRGRVPCMPDNVLDEAGEAHLYLALRRFWHPSVGPTSWATRRSPRACSTSRWSSPDSRAASARSATCASTAGPR